MKFEIRVPISPRKCFFRRIEFLHRSLLACGGLTAAARLVVSVGDDIEPFDIVAREPWSRGKVTWRWVDREAFRRDSFFATVLDRFKVESDADIVLFADADVIFVAAIDDILQSLASGPAIAGVIAHAPPDGGVDWNRVFTDARLPLPSDVHQYSGWRLMCSHPAQRFAPAYYNFGALFVPGNWVQGLGHFYGRSIGIAEKAGFDFFKAQIAVTLALYQLGMRRIALELRYNFPNDPLFDAAYPEDLRDMRILHYLRTEIVDRDRDFATIRTLRSLIGRKDLTGSNEVLRKTVQTLAGEPPLRRWA
jgi:hypothetical protein